MYKEIRGIKIKEREKDRGMKKQTDGRRRGIEEVSNRYLVKRWKEKKGEKGTKER